MPTPTTLAVVAAANLGTDFDVGTQVANKLNVVAASTTTPGKVKFAAASDIAALSAVVAMSPATFLAVLAAVAPTLPTTSGASAGVAARVFLNDNLFAFG